MSGPTQQTIADCRTFYGQLLAVKVLTTDPIALTGVYDIQGVPMVAGDRVCALGQADPLTNGVYEMSASGWDRSPDCEHGDDVGGTAFWVELGDNKGYYTIDQLVSLGRIGIDAVTASRRFDVDDDEFAEVLTSSLASYYYTITALDQSKDYISGNNTAWRSIAKASFPGTDRIRPPTSVYIIAGSSNPSKGIEIRVMDITNNQEIATSGPIFGGAQLVVAIPSNFPTDRAIFEIEARALETGVSYELSSVTISTSE